MANLILASEFTSKVTGAQLWHVYGTIAGTKVEKSDFYFYEPFKALRYAFMLRKRIEGAFIPKGVYNKLMAAVKAAKPAQQEQSESAPVPEASESAPAPEANEVPTAGNDLAEEAPKPKKRSRKSNTKKAEDNK